MRLLLLEDEPALGLLVKESLARNGFAVDLLTSIAEASEALASAPYAALLLDLGLPDGDGLSLLRAMRRSKNPTPVIAITARSAIHERVAGFDCGADDYLVKPFAMEELIARVRALLRRVGAGGDALTVGNLSFQLRAREVEAAGVPLALTARELAILEMLMRRDGHVVTRATLDEGLYAFGEEVESNTIEVYVYRLRKRLADCGATVQIHTIRGVGYLLKTSAA